MDPSPTINSLSEPEFASLVSTIAADPDRRNELTELLHEDHSIYDERGAATHSSNARVGFSIHSRK